MKQFQLRQVKQFEKKSIAKLLVFKYLKAKLHKFNYKPSAIGNIVYVFISCATKLFPLFKVAIWFETAGLLKLA